MKNLDLESVLLFLTGLCFLSLSIFLSHGFYDARQEIALYKKVTSIKIKKMNSNTYTVLYPENNYATKENYFLDSTGQFRRFVVEWWIHCIE